MAPAVPCKTCKKSNNGETRSKTNDFKTKLSCILEASESTRLRMGESLPIHHEDHIAGRGDNSLQHYNLVHKCIPVHQAMKIPAAKAAVDKEWEKLEKIPAWDLTKVRSKSEVIDEARTKGMKVHFASLMDICHLKDAELETKHHKYKGRVVFRGDIVKDDSGSNAVFTDQGSSASQMTAAKSSTLYPDCQFAQDKQQIQYQLTHRLKCKMLRNYGKLQDRNVQTFGLVHHDTNGQNHGPVWKTQSFLLNEICTVILWKDCHGEGNLRKSL